IDRYEEIPLEVLGVSNKRRIRPLDIRLVAESGPSRDVREADWASNETFKPSFTLYWLPRRHRQDIRANGQEFPREVSERANAVTVGRRQAPQRGTTVDLR